VKLIARFPHRYQDEHVPEPVAFDDMPEAVDVGPASPSLSRVSIVQTLSNMSELQGSIVGSIVESPVGSTSEIRPPDNESAGGFRPRYLTQEELSELRGPDDQVEQQASWRNWLPGHRAVTGESSRAPRPRRRLTKRRPSKRSSTQSSANTDSSSVQAGLRPVDESEGDVAPPLVELPGDNVQPSELSGVQDVSELLDTGRL
jgi:hypothetical protein